MLRSMVEISVTFSLLLAKSNSYVYKCHLKALKHLIYISLCILRYHSKFLYPFNLSWLKWPLQCSSLQLPLPLTTESEGN